MHKVNRGHKPRFVASGPLVVASPALDVVFVLAVYGLAVERLYTYFVV